jgi:hypothetical protein
LLLSLLKPINPAREKSDRDTRFRHKEHAQRHRLSIQSRFKEIFRSIEAKRLIVDILSSVTKPPFKQAPN